MLSLKEPLKLYAFSIFLTLLLGASVLFYKQTKFFIVRLKIWVRLPAARQINIENRWKLLS